MKQIFISILLLVVFSCKNIDTEKKEILEVMDMQEKAWSEGDVESFMKGYWNSDSLMFVGKNGIKYGWDTTLANYKESYPDKAAMGSLEFEVLKLEVDGEAAYMLGKWSLIREADNPNGYFTLYWKKINGSWKITIDHTS